MRASLCLALLLPLGFQAQAGANLCETQLEMAQAEHPREIVQIAESFALGDGKAPKPKRLRVRPVPRIKLSRLYSEKDVRRLVNDIFEIKYGKIKRKKSISLAGETEIDARVLRALQIELATRGLTRFLSDRGLLQDRSRVVTLLRKLYDSPRTQTFLASLTVLSFGHRAFFFLPRQNVFEITQPEFDTLFVYGLESYEGKKILARLNELSESQRRRDQFITAFNRVSFAISASLIALVVHHDIDAQAIANGDQLVAAVDQVEEEMDSTQPVDTREDIHYDIVKQQLEAEQKAPLSAADLRVLCGEIPAPHRCH